MDGQEILDLIGRNTQEEDRPYFIVMGNYLTQYAMLEMQLTMLLAALSNGLSDVGAFHILTKGMDCRVKLERIRALAKRRQGIGPRLKARFEYFEQKAIQLRNDLAHSVFWRNEVNAGRYHLLTIETTQATNFDETKIPDVTTRTVDVSELLKAAFWLSQFAKDLSPVFSQAVRREVLEVVNPLTRVPKEDLAGQPQPSHRATPRKRAQKQS